MAVKVTVLDVMMSIHVMHMVMFHGLLPVVSCLEAPECCNESLRFLGLRKAVSDAYFVLTPIRSLKKRTRRTLLVWRRYWLGLDCK